MWRPLLQHCPQAQGSAGLLKGGRQLLLPLPSLKGGQRDREGGKKPRCRGESLVPLLVYSGILMKRRVSSSLIYHIM